MDNRGGDAMHLCRTIAGDRVPGGTYFFTINVLERRADLLVRYGDSRLHTIMLEPQPLADPAREI